MSNPFQSLPPEIRNSMIEAIMASDDEQDNDERQPELMEEATVATLSEVAARYMAGNPYKAGDLVRIRKGYGLRFAGKVLVVLETMDPPLRGEASQDSTGYNSRLDCRCAGIYKGKAVLTHHFESWQLEPYHEAV